MLFNSFGFLFFYLPIVLAGYIVLAGQRRYPHASATWLALASLFFYGYWDARYVPLLMASILFNFLAGRCIAACGAPRARKRWLQAALAVNLGLLAYYKYANFFVDSWHSLNGAPASNWGILLPIGISFFTFTQIAFLVDCYRGQVREYNFIHYTLFVSYFPHLIAGPVLHHQDMMPQFAAQAGAAAGSRPKAADFAVGMSIFVIGLGKKILIADQLSPLVAPVFASGAHPQLIEAWVGALAYAFQLYFDFSGYSDMAIGLSRLFGVRLPLNFNSPYKAADISAFWRRWHMSLSRFLRDYLYIPLGGKRDGVVLRYRNLMLTMLLGGLWHGAGWTFVLWGGLHGLYLVLHHAWRALAGPTRLPSARYWGPALTFLAVTIAWVIFRAPDLATAADILQAMGGAHGIALPHGLAAHADSLRWLTRLGVPLSFDGIRWIDFGAAGVPVLLLAAALAWLAPNTQEIFCHYEPAIEQIVQAGGRLAWTWRPGRWQSLAISLLFLGCLFSMNRVSEFLYFQF